jgi:vancomycin resistance protein VanW
VRGSVYLLGLLAVCVSGCQSARAPANGSTIRQWTPLVEFATSLEGRTQGQRHNATLAAKRIHGAIIAPDATWSFNQTIGQWVRSEGYVRAPVSYGGVLVPAWGGGVCQTSTTLYNAALLAGLEVVERHPHTIAPSYIAPGRDAAVAHGIADLKLRNPYPFPCRIECFVRGDKLVCRLSAGASPQQAQRHARACTLETEVVSRSPAPIVADFRKQPGRAGMRVRLWRTCTVNGAVQRELCHETQYAPLPRGEKASP